MKYGSTAPQKKSSFWLEMLNHSDDEDSDYEEDRDSDYDDSDNSEVCDVEDLNEDCDEDVPLDVLLARLEDSTRYVRRHALKRLGKLDPATLAQHADAVLAMLVHRLEPIRKTAMIVSRKLPRSVTRGIDFNTHRDTHRYIPLRLQRARILRRQLLGCLGWYRCRLRLRVERLLWYWHALPYRPSGQGHAREVEAWRRMMDEL